MRSKSDILPGAPHPLGATPDGAGVNFAVFSEHAATVTLCLFGGAGGGEETARIPLLDRTGHVWHCRVQGIGPGQLYGYRVEGPYDPAAGHRFNSAKLLLDPYARAIDRAPVWHDSMLGYRAPAGGAEAPAIERPDSRDSAAAMPKCLVIESAFDWEGDRKPAIPWEETLIYEAHVKGMTMLHPRVPEPLRGAYAGLAAPAVIEHLKSLGVTAIELMPVHQIGPERRLHESGLANYWGYNPIGYFAPDLRFAADRRPGGAIAEFKALVKAMHAAEIEVILDVVYNHTAEGGADGPTICFRGIDNASYYRLREDDHAACEDFTGCGNSLDFSRHAVLALAMDSLRYWAGEMRVDGFRFDLATALTRGADGKFGTSPFLAAVLQDPMLSRLKLIAEPWDVAADGYRVGAFPPGWREWNGKYRDGVRDFWRGASDSIGGFASRVTGSSDVYWPHARGPSASINFVASHDGFTLADLVSYNDKHNEPNGEHNRDGETVNRSWNCGAEGPSDEPEVLQLRARQLRNFLATLMLSQGVPMLAAGDELGRTQRGNNNAYCQDNPISWIDWPAARADLLEFTRAMVQLRRAHPIFRRREWFTGAHLARSKIKDLGWFRPDGGEMTAEDWNVGYAKTLGAYLNGHAVAAQPRGERHPPDDTFFSIFNAYREPMEFKLPPGEWGRRWQLILNTAEAMPATDGKSFNALDLVPVSGHTTIVLRRIA
ncbi:MAG: glycogen debranching protein GlgX [Candidatus Binataceae bacterium]